MHPPEAWRAKAQRKNASETALVMITVLAGNTDMYFEHGQLLRFTNKIAQKVSVGFSHVHNRAEKCKYYLD